jgi:hypothetical protein
LVLFLHNTPAGNTTAQPLLPMNGSSPTVATLPVYSSDCNPGQAGRSLTRVAPDPAITSVCNMVLWRTTTLGTTLDLTGKSVTVDIWSATDTNAANKNGNLIAYLRAYDPGTKSWTDLGSGTYTADNYSKRNWIHTPISVSISGTKSVPAGQQLELKIEAVAGNGLENMLVAYDTTGFAASVTIP